MAENNGERRGGWLILVLLATAITLGLLGSWRVWYHYQTIALGYELASETSRHRELFGARRKLQLELSSLRREGLQSYRMKSEIGLRAPGPEDLIYVENRSVSRAE